jgi:hypothetical protein
VLFQEDSDLQFNLSNQKSVSLGNNCGSVIQVTSDIIAVSCPSLSSGSTGMISAFSNALEPITTITGKHLQVILLFYFSSET